MVNVKLTLLYDNDIQLLVKKEFIVYNIYIYIYIIVKYTKLVIIDYNSSLLTLHYLYWQHVKYTSSMELLDVQWADGHNSRYEISWLKRQLDTEGRVKVIRVVDYGI